MRTTGIIDQSKAFDFSAPAPEMDTTAEVRMANVTTTKRWKEILTYIDSRKQFYKQFYPGGIPITQLSRAERDAYWMVSEIMQNEFELFKNIIEGTKDAAQ
jgi:hypothetical protein